MRFISSILVCLEILDEDPSIWSQFQVEAVEDDPRSNLLRSFLFQYHLRLACRHLGFCLRFFFPVEFGLFDPKDDQGQQQKERKSGKENHRPNENFVAVAVAVAFTIVLRCYAQARKDACKQQCTRKNFPCDTGHESCLFMLVDFTILFFLPLLFYNFLSCKHALLIRLPFSFLFFLDTTCYGFGKGAMQLKTGMHVEM